MHTSPACEAATHKLAIVLERAWKQSWAAAALLS